MSLQPGAKEEDRQSLAVGKRRIRPEYIECIKVTEKEVEMTKKWLQKARRSH